MKKIISILLIGVSSLIAQQTKTSSILETKLSRITKSQVVKIWVYFTDKGNSVSSYLENPELVVSKKSLHRRKKEMDNSALVDFRDVPVLNHYIKILSSYNIKIHQRSRWFNSVSAYANSNVINQIEKLPFIKKIDLVRSFKLKKKDRNLPASQMLKSTFIDSSTFNYGSSITQLEQIDVPAVHDLGFYGQGITICIMDAGFNNLGHEAFANIKIIASYDFVNNDNNVGDQGDMGTGNHGTETLSTIGGFKEGKLVGPAFGASFLLAKTENTDSETPVEEDNWIAAVEWADSIGVDVTSTSLGYLVMDTGYTGYTWQDMDGNTATITKAADLAAARGIVVVNSAGNEGFNSSHNTLDAPADGDSVIAVGAVTSSGIRASFSSVGPTVDGRIKPDIMAMGVGVVVASPFNTSGYTTSTGTSFSCPLSAGVAALVLCANPNLTPMQVRDALRKTASQHTAPNNEYGWGIIDALAAINYATTEMPESKNILPTKLELMQNYPNPFNPSTIIKYSIPAVEVSNVSYLQHVSLKVYDILGREVATLVNREQASGNYKVQFNAAKLASGIYVYCVTLNNGVARFLQSKKMVLLR